MMLKKLGLKFKDAAKITDRLRMSGGGKRPGYRGIQMPDGSPVPVEVIMKQFGVNQLQAGQIAERMSR